MAKSKWAQIDGLEDGQEYKQWLSNRFVGEDEFNKYTFEEVDAKRTAFEKWKKEHRDNGKVILCLHPYCMSTCTIIEHSHSSNSSLVCVWWFPYIVRVVFDQPPQEKRKRQPVIDLKPSLTLGLKNHMLPSPEPPTCQV